MSKVVGVMEFYGHLAEIRSPEFPMFPSFSGAQLYDIIEDMGFMTQNVPLSRMILRDPEVFRAFFERDDSTKEKEMFSNIYDEAGLEEIDILCVCYNYTTHNEPFNRLLEYIKRRKEDMEIVMVSFFSHVKDGAKMQEKEIVSHIIEEEDVFAGLRRYMNRYTSTRRRAEEKDSISSSIGKVRYFPDDIHTKRLFYNNMYKRYRPGIFSEIELPVPKSIGCESGCLYCPFSKHAKREDLEHNPVDIIEDIINDTGAKYFYIVQNDICRDETSLNDFCNEIIGRKLNMMWESPIEAKDFISRELFYKMRKSGCVSLFFGVDTASEKLIKQYERKTDPSIIKNAILNCSKEGIFVKAFVLVGLPGETEEDFRKTIEFCDSIKEYVDQWIVSEFFLSERTRMFNDPEKFGIRIGHPLKEFDFEDEEFDVSFAGSMIDMGFHGRKYSYTLNDGTSFEEHKQIMKERKDFFENRFKPNKFFSFGAYDNLRSFERMDSLMRYISDKKVISIGLLSNQNVLGLKNVRLAGDYRFVSDDYFRFIIERAARSGEKSILITGGEPLIHPEAFKLFKNVKEKGLKCVVHTNARMLANYRFCRQVSRFIDEILVVDPAVTKDEYERISRVHGSWEQSRSGMLLWKRLGKRTVHFHPEQ